MSYMLGTDVKVEGQFIDEDEALFDPDVVICKTKDPAGVEASYTYGTDAALVRDSEGIYHLWLFADQEGTWAYRFKCSGGARVANETEFEVEASAFATP